ncbi:MAG: hypothetical protein CMR00_07325 [[Chlorobium] sp. 445]|nr:MAG: hypothetical protein CMR00_07325 [[Chlorobium] sp. 445]
MAQEKSNSNDPIGSILESIERLAKLAENLQQKAETFSKAGEIDLSRIKEGLKASYNISFKTARGSVQRTASSAFAKTASQKKSDANPMPARLEPEVDLFVEDTTIKIYAQLPGVSEKDIHLALRDDMLELEAKGIDRIFYKELLLPKPVQPDSLQTRFHNGILEITLILEV